MIDLISYFTKKIEAIKQELSLIPANKHVLERVLEEGVSSGDKFQLKKENKVRAQEKLLRIQRSFLDKSWLLYWALY